MADHEHLAYQVEKMTEDYKKATELADMKELADAKWSTLVRVGNIANAVVDVAALAVQGYIGECYKRHLEAQLESIELLRLFQVLLKDPTLAEGLVECVRQ